MFLRTLALVLAMLSYSYREVAPISSQTAITVRLLNSRNGKPVITNDVEIWIDKDRSHVITTHTGPDGIASATIPDGTSEISIYAEQDGWYLFRCDLTKDASKPAPVYPLDQIRKSGIAAVNRCGRRTASTRPGEITLFLRPQHFLEKMKI